jgi:diadenylate cyclase
VDILFRFKENISIIFEQLRFFDIVDMLLVWIVVYRVLLLIKQTRAVQILSGMGILAIAYVLSIWGELYTLNWLLDIFFNNLFVIVVILFQGEIRRALVHIGRNPFFVEVSAVEETHVVEEITKGARQICKYGYGALIVIEREVGLEDFLEVGTPLDSEVKAEVLTSLFLPEGPLHDGAVVMRGGRIHWAGCLLPLSKNPNISRYLGTRHRAALGLSEETDAIVIVVSEERKHVSIAINGELKRDLTINELRETLYELLSLNPEVEPERSRV